MTGFIDVHTHGAINIDVNGAGSDQILELCSFFEKHGVSAWYPTIMTDTVDNTDRAISSVVEAVKNQENGARIAGIHLEGPFLNPVFSGAMPHELLREGDCRLVEHYQETAHGYIKRMTVAPEIPGVLDVIRNFRSDISFSMGHSNAEFDEAMAGVKAGAVCVTHTGNAMRLFHQHQAGLLGAALYSDVWCETIADNLHLDKSSFNVLLKVKGIDRIIVITDSMSAAGMGDGNFILGGNRVIVKNGDARMADRDVRAGSILTMDKAFENVMKFTGLDESSVMPMFCTNQKRMMGLA